MKIHFVSSLIALSLSSMGMAESRGNSEPVLRLKHWQEGSTLVSDDSGLSLTDVFGYDDFDPAGCEAAGCEAEMSAANPRQVCVIGDLNQVCSLLAKMSDTANAEYDAGLHELTTLEGCFVVKGPAVARIQLKSRHDWEPLTVGGTVDIAKCE
jgi:hypothetical protein